jgi:hypothetical protein
MKRSWVIRAVLSAVLLFANQAAARVISTFDAGLDGWVGYHCVVSWNQSGGNPSPALHFGDNTGDWAQIVAPAKFHGRWSATGAVSADIRFTGTNSGGIAYPPAFAISNGTTTYQYIFSTKVTTSWQTFAASLTDPQWIRVTNTSGWYNWNPPLGTETLAQVLQNVTDFHIRTDYTDDTVPAKDAADLDNISVPSLHAPSGMILLLLN